MTPFTKQARILALEGLLAHFPNPYLIAMGIERIYGARLARALPQHMEKIRSELERELRRTKNGAPQK